MGKEERIIAKFNAELGGNVENLARSKELVNKYVNQLNNIERKVKIIICKIPMNHKFSVF